jgi:hypothetical protein
MNSSVAEGPLSARALLRWQFRVAHELLEAEIDQIATEAVHRHPPGTAAPAGACYAQVVLCEDLSVNGVPQRWNASRALNLGRTHWRQRDAFALADPTDWRAWAQRVRVDFG